MTKEEEKTIYRLNKDKNNPLACGDITIVNVEDIETVLNMLKEKENEIEKKDKVINLMADFINKTGGGKRAFSCMFIENDECNKNGCRCCIKQYFKELAERKSEE